MHTRVAVRAPHHGALLLHRLVATQPEVENANCNTASNETLGHVNRYVATGSRTRTAVVFVLSHRSSAA